jgi:hypothetical protein
MDGRKAFDTVWHEGMLYKLLTESSIDSATFLAFKSMYTNMLSCVKYQGKVSECFIVLQGTRQGGKTSPKSGFGICVYNVRVSSPTVADDILLVSYSVNGLNGMLDICSEYSKWWRYSYNAEKCALMVLNERTNNSRDILLSWYTKICETSNYVNCDPFLSTRKMVEDACTKLRGTYLSIINSGISPQCLNPITLKKIYYATIIPIALYGSELWSSITHTDIMQLERSHRFCIKNMLSFPNGTSTEFALSAIDAVPIDIIVEHRKLKLLGQLCRLSDVYLAKHILNSRLVCYLNYDKKTSGLFPTICAILLKYGLYDVINTYIREGTFPSKIAWERILNQQVLSLGRVNVSLNAIPLMSLLQQRAQPCII